MYNAVIQYLYTLQNDCHSKSSLTSIPTYSYNFFLVMGTFKSHSSSYFQIYNTVLLFFNFFFKFSITVDSIILVSCNTIFTIVTVTISNILEVAGGVCQDGARSSKSLERMRASPEMYVLRSPPLRCP